MTGLAALAPVLERLGGTPAGWREALGRYAELLQLRNEQVNLVSRRSIDRVVETQILPSLAALLVVPAEQELRILDVGTGGGLPGIPLKILRPEIRLDLLDATRKKTEFVSEAVADLGLEDCAVHWGRIESPPGELTERAPFDVIFARAVGQDPHVSRAAEAFSPGTPLWVFDRPEVGEHVLDHPEFGAITSLRRLQP